MKNPVFLYFLIRLGLFAVVLAIMLGLIQDWMLATVFAAVISFALSIIFLRKQRDAMSTHIYQRSQQRRDGMTKPGTKDVENDLLDGKGD